MECAYYHHQPHNVKSHNIALFTYKSLKYKTTSDATAAHCVYFLKRNWESKKTERENRKTVRNVRSQVYWLQLLIKPQQTSHGWRHRYVFIVNAKIFLYKMYGCGVYMGSVIWHYVWTHYLWKKLARIFFVTFTQNNWILLRFVLVVSYFFYRKAIYVRLFKIEFILFGGDGFSLDI